MNKIKDDRTKEQRLWDWTLGIVVAGQEPFYVYHHKTGSYRALHKICATSAFWYEVSRVENLVWGPVNDQL